MNAHPRMNPAAMARFLAPTDVPLVRDRRGKLVAMENPPTGLGYKMWKMTRGQRYAERFGLDIGQRGKTGTTATRPAAASKSPPSTAPAGGSSVEAAGTAGGDPAGSVAAEAADHRRRMRNARRRERQADRA